MPAASGRLVAGGSLALLGVATFFTCHAARVTMPPWLAGLAAVVQLMAIGWLLTVKWAPRHRLILLVAALAAITAAFSLLDLPTRVVGLAVAGLCHAAAYSGLLIWFGSSLRPHHEPVVTGFARRLRRTMPDKVRHYTRRVTMAWCLFFTAQIGLSAALLLFAPESVWSAFINLLNLPLLAAMVLGEFSIRLILFRHEPHTSLIDTLSAMRHVRALPGDQ